MGNRSMWLWELPWGFLVLGSTSWRPYDMELPRELSFYFRYAYVKTMLWYYLWCNKHLWWYFCNLSAYVWLILPSEAPERMKPSSCNFFNMATPLKKRCIRGHQRIVCIFFWVSQPSSCPAVIPKRLMCMSKNKKSEILCEQKNSSAVNPP